MTHPVSVVIDCGDPRFPAAFWAPALGYRDTEWPTYNHGVLVGESGAEAALLLLQTDIEPEDKRAWYPAVPRG